jgi:hypothetical protein
VLAASRFVRARATTVSVGRRRCAVAAGTPLAALEAVRRTGGPGYRLRDYGACSGRAADASGLFVFEVGGERNRRTDGWVYKVGRRVPGIGAADSAGRRLRGGDRVTWFYCRMQLAGGCQRTLEVTLAASRVAPGAPLRAMVRGYDDNGRGTPIAGATVVLGASRAVTGGDGVVTLTAPSTPRRYFVSASRAGLVPSFPVEVRVA